MDEWKAAACILCYANCGLKVRTDGRAIVQVHGDKDHPRSRGYLCQKAQRLTYYSDRPDRLASPLRRRADGEFEPISWNQAIREIADKLKAIRARHGADALGYYGGGGQGNHAGGGYGIMTMRGLGARHVFSSLAQEKSGRFWVNGHMFGSQNCNHAPMIEDADLLILQGSNMWEAQCEPGARNHLRHAAKAKDRKIIVIDPARTKDAAMADLHLQLRPGTDAYLVGAMLQMLVARGAVDSGFIDARTTGWPTVRDVLTAIPVDDWIARADVARADVERAVDMIAAADAMALRTELGIEMGRNSTLNSYVTNLLFLITGHFGRPGTQTIHTWLQPLMGNSKGAHSAATDMPEIAGLYPPNRFPAEILTDHPDRLRAVVVDSSNPANSAANTKAVEAALDALDLLVVVDVAMTETAAKAHYVLPASSQYEKWEFTLFTLSAPVNYFHLRPPLFDPLPGTMAEPDIYAALAKELGLLPPDAVLADLRAQAANDRAAFAAGFQNLLAEQRHYAVVAPIILHQTLGQSLANGAASVSILWPACHSVAKRHGAAVRTAIGSTADGPALGEELFDRILNSPSGTAFTVTEPEDVWTQIAHKDGVIRLAVPETLDWLAELEARDQPAKPGYPYVVSFGQRRGFNANQIIRDPRWRKDDADGALRIHPDDLADIGAIDGGWVTVQTATGQLTARAEADTGLRRGFAVLPHGYGMRTILADGKPLVVGPKINLLTASDDCDPIAATPYHKNVAADLRRATNAEADRSEAEASRVRAHLASA